MNIMDEFHLLNMVFNVHIYHITSPSNNKFYKEQNLGLFRYHQ
jgi:hypothetical protein